MIRFSIAKIAVILKNARSSAGSFSRTPGNTSRITIPITGRPSSRLPAKIAAVMKSPTGDAAKNALSLSRIQPTIDPPASNTSASTASQKIAPRFGCTRRCTKNTTTAEPNPAPIAARVPNTSSTSTYSKTGRMLSPTHGS